MAKGPDVLTYAREGICDLAIIGRDILLEHPREGTVELDDLGFGRCRMALAGPRSMQGCSSWWRGPFPQGVLRVATKYPSYARSVLSGRPFAFRVIPLVSSVELAPHLGLSDVILDLVQTGRTLAENELKTLEELDVICARLVANSVALTMKRQELSLILSSLQQWGGAAC